MTWDETVAKYPWVVIDPSSLIGNSTPTTLTDLASATNPLWRQFYIAWLVAKPGCPYSAARATGYLGDLNEINKTSKDAAKRDLYDAAKRFFNTYGDLSEFRAAIREIKDAVKAKAKEEPNTNAGLLFAADAAVNAVGNAKPDEALVSAMSNLQNNTEKEALLQGVNDYLVHMKKFFELAGAGDSWDSVEQSIGRGMSNLRTWEASLRVCFTKYQAVLPYLQADAAGRADLVVKAKLSSPDLVELYQSAETGALVKEVWATISRYGQALASLGVDIANGCELIVRIAKSQSEKDMAKNFTAAFPEAATGLLIAKTVVGVGSTIAGFFPPIGTAVAGSLNLAMLAADKATQFIMVRMAKEDPNVVLNQFGRTFDEVPSDARSALAEKLAEYSPEVIEFLMKAAELGHQAADLYKDVAGLDEAVKKAMEETLKQAGNAIGGVGAVVTVATLTAEWYKWSEDVKRDLRNRDGLTDDDVKKLQTGLADAWTQQASNTFWDIKTATFVGMDGADYKVVMNGVPGRIRGANFVFAPDDRSKVHQLVLSAAQKANPGGIPYHDSTVSIDWASVKVTSEPGETGQLECTATGTIRSGTQVPCTLRISVEGRVSITSVDLPRSTAEFGRLASSYQQLSDGNVQYTLDWSSAKRTSSHTWYFRADVAASTPDGQRKTVTVKVPRGGVPRISNAGAKDDADDVQVKTVPVQAEDKAKVKKLLVAAK